MINPRRLAPPLTAGILAGLAAVNPGITVQRDLRDVLLTVDITRSMNVRDLAGRARLTAVQESLRAWIAEQPCGARVGLAIFTERRSMTLFTPVDVCADFASLAATLDMLNWRLAWEGDSRISKGLNHALSRADELGVTLVFITDGHEAPPLPYSGPDAFRGESPGGLIVGVGGAVPAPIPKFDDVGREIGFYQPEDVIHAPARLGAPPDDAAARPGYHPRNNPYGEADLDGNEHLSSQRAAYLERLAEAREMRFVRLADGADAINKALASTAAARTVDVRRGLGPIFGALALIALLVGWLPPSSRHTSKTGQRSNA